MTTVTPAKKKFALGELHENFYLIWTEFSGGISAGGGWGGAVEQILSNLYITVRKGFQPPLFKTPTP